MGSGKLKQCIVCAICQLSVMVASAANSWFEPITDRLMKDPELDLNKELISWLIYALTIGAIIGSLVSGDLTNRIGRKSVIMSIGPLCLAGWIIVLYSKSVVSLIVVRLLHGVTMGVVYTIPPIYLAEIVESNLRGLLSGTFEVALDLGNIYSLCFERYISYDMFAYACLSLPLISSLIWVFMPETPYYLLMTKRGEKAKKVLKYLRDDDIEEEFQEMQKAVMEEMSHGSPWKALFSNKLERKAFIILQIVSFAKHMTGIKLIKQYVLGTISNIESALLAEDMSILLAVILTLIAIFSAIMSDWVGRKPLLLISYFGTSISHFLTGGYYYFHQKMTIDISNYAWTLYLGFVIYCILSDIGVGSLLQTLQSEMFSANTRGIAAGITEGFASILTLLVNKLYAPVHKSDKVYYIFCFYSFISFISGILLYFLADETAGKTIGQMKKPVIH